jgi:hypothetical protein
MIAWFHDDDDEGMATSDPVIFIGLTRAGEIVTLIASDLGIVTAELAENFAGITMNGEPPAGLTVRAKAGEMTRAEAIEALRETLDCDDWSRGEADENGRQWVRLDIAEQAYERARDKAGLPPAQWDHDAN